MVFSRSLLPASYASAMAMVGEADPRLRDDLPTSSHTLPWSELNRRARRSWASSLDGAEAASASNLAVAARELSNTWRSFCRRNAG